MKRDDFIRMAKKAGLLRAGDGWTEPHRWGETEVKAFAALVIENFLQRSGQYLTNDASREVATKEAVEAEREECAKVVDGWPDYDVEGLAEAIRARGNHDN